MIQLTKPQQTSDSDATVVEEVKHAGKPVEFINMNLDCPCY